MTTNLNGPRKDDSNQARPVVEGRSPLGAESLVTGLLAQGSDYLSLRQPCPLRRKYSERRVGAKAVITQMRAGLLET